MGLQVNRNAMRMQHPFERVCNLLPDPFLNGESFSEQVHEPCQL
jgi:hypothetical protein